MDDKPTWSPTYHAMDNLSWYTRFCVKPTLEEVALTKNRETMNLQNLTILDLLLTYCVEGTT
jgi:hypothetical protein